MMMVQSIEMIVQFLTQPRLEFVYNRINSDDYL